MIYLLTILYIYTFIAQNYFFFLNLTLPMLENMQWVEGVSKWIFPAIGYGIKKFCNTIVYRR